MPLLAHLCFANIHNNEIQIYISPRNSWKEEIYDSGILYGIPAPTLTCANNLIS